jgi:hypothetical protein
MILKHGLVDTTEILDHFASVLPFTIPYRDVSPGKQILDPHLGYCWGGLLKAKQKLWVLFSP